MLAALVMPITAWLLRVRRRRAAVTQQDLIEAEWDDLTSHLGDLGLEAPHGATLRQLRERYVTQGHLDDESATAMRRVTATLEKARYDRPERTTPQEAIRLHHDIRSIRRQVGGTRALKTRVRSFLWPERGVAFWRDAPRPALGPHQPSRFLTVAQSALSYSAGQLSCDVALHEVGDRGSVEPSPSRTASLVSAASVVMS